MIFTDFLKAREGKNKYGMIALTFNRSTKLSHIVPNGSGIYAVPDVETLNLV